MSALDSQPRVSDSVIIRIWRRIPILIRAVIAGVFVYAVVGLVVWLPIVALVPAPWSLVLMVGVLFLYWRYFSGSWWPRSTAGIRRESFRATRLSKGVWKWSLITAALIVVVTQSGLVITFRVFPFPADAFALGFDYNAFPIWLVWLYIILTASVVAITEEVGFRGYMQVPLEKRYGPVAAIAIVSTLFMLLHLNQAWAPFVLVHLFIIAVLWGILAYASGSLLPGIISHTVTDIFGFSYWFTDVAGRFDRQVIAETGIDSHFIVWFLILVSSAVLFSWAARKTLAARRQT
jgi:membrane protease YdiL (CAAX protease family)